MDGKRPVWLTRGPQVGTRWGAALVLSAIVAWHLPAPAARAEDERKAGVAAELASVQRKIGDAERKLQTLRKRQAEIQASLQPLTKEITQVTAAQDTAAASVADIDKELRRLEGDARRAAIEVDARRRKVLQRLIGLFKVYRRTAAIDYLFQASSATELLKRSRYLAVIAARDRQNLARLAEGVKTLLEKSAAVERSKLEREKAAQELAEQRELLEQKQLQKATLLRDFDQQAQAQSKLLERHKDTAERLELIIASLTGDPAPIVTPDPVVPPPMSASSSSVSVPVDAPIAFLGLGLEPLRGKLPLPVPGKIVQKFGKQRHEEFSDLVFVKGLELAAASGVPVRAVADGKVIFQKPLPGLGLVVILDHGKRYYTLYGRVGASNKRVGDLVKAGDEIAVLGAPDSRGSNLYFELRLEGKAVDPARFLANRGT